MTAAKNEYLAAADVESLLTPGRQGWAVLNDYVMSLPPEALKQLIEAEVAGRRRQEVIRRIYGRLNRLRAHEEVEQLMRGELPW
jgi:hypothetical protein